MRHKRAMVSRQNRPTMGEADLVVGTAKKADFKRALFSVSLVSSPTKPLTQAVGQLP